MWDLRYDVMHIEVVITYLLVVVRDIVVGALSHIHIKNSADVSHNKFRKVSNRIFTTDEILKVV